MKEAHFIFEGHELWLTATKVAVLLGCCCSCLCWTFFWHIQTRSISIFVLVVGLFQFCSTTIVQLPHVFYSCWTDNGTCFRNIVTPERERASGTPFLVLVLVLPWVLHVDITWDWIHILFVSCYYLVFCVVFMRCHIYIFNVYT